MKKNFLPFLILCLFLLDFAHSGIQKTQTFKDEVNKVSFQYPHGWKKKTEGRRIYFESPDLAVKIYYLIREKEPGKNAYQQMESFFAEIGTANEWNAHRSEVGQAQLALWGVQEGTFGYGTRMAKQETRFYAALAVKNNHCYILEAQLLKSKDRQYKTILFEIFKSIRIAK